MLFFAAPRKRPEACKKQGVAISVQDAEKDKGGRKWEKRRRQEKR